MHSATSIAADQKIREFKNALFSQSELIGVEAGSKVHKVGSKTVYEYHIIVVVGGDNSGLKEILEAGIASTKSINDKMTLNLPENYEAKVVRNLVSKIVKVHLGKEQGMFLSKPSVGLLEDKDKRGADSGKKKKK